MATEARTATACRRRTSPAWNTRWSRLGREFKLIEESHGKNTLNLVVVTATCATRRSTPSSRSWSRCEDLADGAPAASLGPAEARRLSQSLVPVRHDRDALAGDRTKGQWSAAGICSDVVLGGPGRPPVVKIAVGVAVQHNERRVTTRASRRWPTIRTSTPGPDTSSGSSPSPRRPSGRSGSRPVRGSTALPPDGPGAALRRRPVLRTDRAGAESRWERGPDGG